MHSGAAHPRLEECADHALTPRVAAIAWIPRMESLDRSVQGLPAQMTTFESVSGRDGASRQQRHRAGVRRIVRLRSPPRRPRRRFKGTQQWSHRRVAAGECWRNTHHAGRLQNACCAGTPNSSLDAGPTPSTTSSVRGRGLKPLIRRRGRVLEPNRATASRRPTPTSPPKSNSACSRPSTTAGTKPSPTALTNRRGVAEQDRERRRPT